MSRGSSDRPGLVRWESLGPLLTGQLWWWGWGVDPSPSPALGMNVCLVWWPSDLGEEVPPQGLSSALCAQLAC